MTDTEKLVAVGTLEGITEKPSGWTTVTITLPGKEYPLKLDTKLPALIDAARAAGTNTMAWTYSEHDSGTENPNRPGSNYINRRLEKVSEADTAAPAASAPSSGPPPLSGGDKDRAITRMACLKAAAETLSGDYGRGSEDLPLEVMKAAQRYEQWVYRDITDIPF